MAYWWSIEQILIGILMCNKTNPIFELYAFFRSFCIPYCLSFVVTWQSGSSNSHHTLVHMTKSLLMWLSASSCDSQSHSLITFYLTHNILLPSSLLLSFTFNLYSHSMMLSYLLLSLSPLPSCHSLHITIHSLTNHSHSMSYSLIRLPLPLFSLHLSLSLTPSTLNMLTTCITHLYD